MIYKQVSQMQRSLPEMGLNRFYPVLVRSDTKVNT